MIPPKHSLVSLATEGVAPLLEEASPNVPRQMHRAAAEEECASLSVKGRWVGAYISSPCWCVCRYFGGPPLTQPY